MRDIQDAISAMERAKSEVEDAIDVMENLGLGDVDTSDLVETLSERGELGEALSHMDSGDIADWLKDNGGIADWLEEEDVLRHVHDDVEMSNKVIEAETRYWMNGGRKEPLEVLDDVLVKVEALRYALLAARQRDGAPPEQTPAAEPPKAEMKRVTPEDTVLTMAATINALIDEVRSLTREVAELKARKADIAPVYGAKE